MSYRIGCIATRCKKAGIKIEKDELRLGVWVPFQESGSFKYKHWGCISGLQIKHMRDYLDPNETGNYEWDKLDGYDDESKSGLVNHPDLQEKVRRVITQGFVDPEDFNGDPEMNRLGEKGIYNLASKRAMREDDVNRNRESVEPEGVVAATEKENGKASKKKRTHNDIDITDDDHVLDSKPTVKKRATKTKKEEDKDVSEDVKPRAKRTRKVAVKPEIGEEMNQMEAIETKPEVAAKKGRKKAVKDEPSDASNDLDIAEVNPKTTNKRRRAVAVKPEVNDEANDLSVTEAKPKRAIKKDPKKAIKKERTNEHVKSSQNSADKVKNELAESSNVLSAIPASEDLQEPDTSADVAHETESLTLRKKKGGRNKSLELPTVAPNLASTRVTRRRNASKK